MSPISRRTFWSGLIAVLSTPAWARPKKGGIGIGTPTVVTITGVLLSLSTFSAPISDGTPIADITVSTTGGPFTGTLDSSLTGANAGSFRLSGTTLPAQLLANGTVTAGTYADVKITPIQAGAVNSGTAYQVGPIIGSSLVSMFTDTIEEVNGATSKGFNRHGVLFARGAVPTGSAVKRQRAGADVPCQYDGITRWDDGSLRIAVEKTRDTDFNANEGRTYTTVKYTGSFDNTSSLTLSDALAGTNFTIEFTGITGSTTGSIPNQTFSVNTAALTATRVTQYEKGGICDSWEICGYCTSDGTNEQLWIEFYLSAWKDAGGAVIDHEFGGEPSLYWWSKAGKEKLTYTATLKNGAATIATYSSVQHVYHAQWVTVRQNDDHQHGKRHWRVAIPTLNYKPDRAYWVSTKLVPHYDVTKTTWTNPYNNAAGKTYVPGSVQSHRPGIDAAGAYAGRGLLTNPDSIAFLTQLPLDVRIARVNTLVGPHIPYHYRSNEQRTRPGDAGPDIAATAISIWLQDERGGSTPSGYYDFTADGMPAAIHASAHPSSSATYKGGYVAASGGVTSGSTVWGLSANATHAVSYSYFMYLLEGERYLWKATLDLAMNLAHQRQASEFGYLGKFPVNTMYGNGFNGAPTNNWTGIALGNNQGPDDRGNAWAALILGHAYRIVPDNDVQRACFNRFHDHQLEFLGDNYAYMPQEQKDCGAWQSCLNGGSATSAPSPWQLNWQSLMLLDNYFGTRNATALAVGKDMGNFVIGQVTDRMGMCNAYRGMLIKNTTVPYNASTNPWPSRGDWYWWSASPITISGNTITCSRSSNFHSLNYTNGDKVIFPGRNTSSVSVPWPPELNTGQVYYMVNVSGDTFQVAATPGGAAIPLANYSGGQYVIAVQLQSADAITDMRTQMTGVDADEYAAIARCALIANRAAGHPDATQALVDKIQTALATPAALDGSTWATWSHAYSG